MHRMTLISLSLTPLTCLCCVAVLLVWWRQTRRAITAKDRTAEQWLILGVAISFAGQLLDNSYWSVWWYLDYTGDHPHLAAKWLKYGVAGNIIFRQTAAALAAACHLKAYSQYLIERCGECPINGCDCRPLNATALCLMAVVMVASVATILWLLRAY